jgi:hypothetical protein
LLIVALISSCWRGLRLDFVGRPAPSRLPPWLIQPTKTIGTAAPLCGLRRTFLPKSVRRRHLNVSCKRQIGYGPFSWKSPTNPSPRSLAPSTCASTGRAKLGPKPDTSPGPSPKPSPRTSADLLRHRRATSAPRAIVAAPVQACTSLSTPPSPSACASRAPQTLTSPIASACRSPRWDVAGTIP